MAKVDLNAKRVTDRLLADGWTKVDGTQHDKFAHPDHPGIRIMVPRHRTLTPGVARSIAKAAGWL